MKTILIIVPYFGAFPKMFPFWLHTAYENPSVDFLIVTDNHLNAQGNVKVVNMQFEELKSKIQELFDFSITIPSPYKLCDFKGAYGAIFSDYIHDADFWGFGDIDLVYGNIRTFFTPEILETYWVISGWGHLTLYKNDEVCNNFFKIYLEGFQYYKKVFACPKNSAFDEFNHKGLSDLWKYLYPDKIWDSRLFDDIRVPRLSFNFISEFHPEYSWNLIFEYHDRHLFRIYNNAHDKIVREETLYAHFQQRSFLKILTTHTDHYLIVPNKFINMEQVTPLKLKKWTKPNDLYRHIWNQKNRIKRRLKIICKSLFINNIRNKNV